MCSVGILINYLQLKLVHVNVFSLEFKLVWHFDEEKEVHKLFGE